MFLRWITKYQESDIAEEQYFGRGLAVLTLTAVLLAIVVFLLFVWPNHYEPSEPAAISRASILQRHADKTLGIRQNAKDNIIQSVRSDLFKPATALRNKPVTDKTIEKIKSRLKLQCIMDINREPVAYIHIEGVGLKQCRTGQTVHDLFTVLNVNNNQVELSIIDHKIMLRM